MAARSEAALSVAMGGVFAALALAILCLGGLIPLATFVCPMLCILILEGYRRRFGSRLGWAWYGAVAVLGALLGPDKEAAAAFAFLGFYPLVKPWLDRKKGRVLYKLTLFNGAVCLMYWVLLRLFGMEALATEFREMGAALLLITLLLGNLTFFLLDLALGSPRLFRRKR